MRKVFPLLLISLVFASCSTPPSAEPLGVHHLLIESLRFRKPDGAFQCETADRFLSELQWGEILKCLQSARSDAKLSFLVDRKDTNPEFVLQDSSQNPSCVTTVLAKIPVPREIFYQGEDLDCYASGLAMGHGKVRLDVALPIASPLRSETDVRQLVLSWVLTLFWSERQGVFPARPFTDSLCQECLGEGQVIHSLKPPRAVWPADSMSVWPAD